MRIGPQTITEDGIKREELITYLNITASEFLDLDKKGEYVHNNIQSLFINNDVNPEILKEIRLDG